MTSNWIVLLKRPNHKFIKERIPISPAIVFNFICLKKKDLECDEYPTRIVGTFKYYFPFNIHWLYTFSMIDISQTFDNKWKC